MKYPVYAMRDVYVGFGAPQVHQNEEVAKRDFKYKVNQENGMMNYQPKDFSLYRIGKYNTDSGHFEAELPCLVCEGVDVFGS